MSNNELKKYIDQLQKNDLDEKVIEHLLIIEERENIKLQKRDLIQYKKIQKEKIVNYRHQLACMDYLIFNLEKEKN